MVITPGCEKAMIYYYLKKVKLPYFQFEFKENL